MSELHYLRKAWKDLVSAMGANAWKEFVWGMKSLR